MRRFSIIINGIEYRVSVRRVNRTLYKVLVGDKTFNVVVREDRVAIAKKVERKRKEKVEEFEGFAVRANLPGIISRIIVKEGDRVRKGDVIMILEAMKMESEIKSPRDGIVKQIVVKEGDRVDVNDVLVVID